MGETMDEEGDRVGQNIATWAGRTLLCLLGDHEEVKGSVDNTVFSPAGGAGKPPEERAASNGNPTPGIDANI